MSSESDYAFPLRLDWSTALGLTKRELFAAMAMQGMLTRGVLGTKERPWDAHLAANAVQAADALLTALKDEP